MEEGPTQTPLDVSFPADVSCLGAMSVLFTAERVGHRAIALSIGDRRETIQLVRAEFAAGPNVMTLGFRAGGKVAVGRTACAGAFDVQLAASIGASAKELTTGARITGGPVLVSCDAGAKFADVVDVYLKTRPSDASPLAGLRCEGRASAPLLAFDGPSDAPAPTAPWGRDDSVGGTPKFKMGDASILADDNVRRGALTVTGALAEADIVSAMDKRMTDVRRCYAGAVAANPVLQGNVAIGLEIGKSGELMTVENAGATLPDNAVVDCILAQAAAATFPAADKVTRVTFPIAFTPPKKK
ncbi:MAG: AgmX/PglI C-terminal domain-containing protein [Polyangiaceae bacterium]